MDYIKVKTKHVFFSKHLTDKEFRAWVTSMAVTAQIEEFPSDDELLTYIPPKALESYKEKQSKCRRSYREVIAKVLEDCDVVKHKRAVSKRTSQQYREKLAVGDTSRDSDKIKGDTTKKRREEEIKEEDSKLNKYKPKDPKLNQHLTLGSLIIYVNKLKLDEWSTRTIISNLKALKPFDTFCAWELIESTRAGEQKQTKGEKNIEKARGILERKGILSTDGTNDNSLLQLQ